MGTGARPWVEQHAAAAGRLLGRHGIDLLLCAPFVAFHSLISTSFRATVHKLIVSGNVVWLADSNDPQKRASQPLVDMCPIQCLSDISGPNLLA